MENWAIKVDKWASFSKGLEVQPEAKKIIENRCDTSCYEDFIIIEADTEVLGDITYIRDTFPSLKETADEVLSSIFCVATEDTGLSLEALRQEKNIWDLA